MTNRDNIFMKWIKIDDLNDIPLDTFLLFFDKRKGFHPIYTKCINDSEYGIVIVDYDGYCEAKNFSHYCYIEPPND